MFYKLVFVTQTILVQDAVIIHHDRVVHVATEREVIRSEGLDVAEKAERASPADLFQERSR